MRKGNKKKNSNKKIKITILVIIIIIILLLLGGCTYYRYNSESSRLQTQKLEAAVKKYLENHTIPSTDKITIPFYVLREDHLLDNAHIDKKCDAASYVIVTKDQDGYHYEHKFDCDGKSQIELKGSNKIEVEAGKPYAEEGATSPNGNVIISGKPNTSVPGTYFVSYDDGENVTIRVVEVVDRTKPVITLVGGETVYVNLNGTYHEPGYSAKDNVDGVITEKVKVSGNITTSTAGTYLRYYTVSDKAGNETMVTRTVIVKKEAPVITLKGETAVTIEVGGTYIEAGYSATDSKDGDLTNNIVVRGSVNANKVGTYVLTYEVTNSRGSVSSTTRTVEVKDTTRPVITLNGNANMTLEVGSAYIEEGATAFDNYDGDLTNSIKVIGKVEPNQIGTYIINYQVTDKNGNTAQVTRTIKVVDTIAPVVSLNGPEVIYMNANETYQEQGVRVVDNSGKDFKPQIISNLDVTKLGTYTITYTVTDQAGNTTKVTRTVIVEDKQAPVITLNGKETVEIEAGSTYVEEGAVVTDNYSKDITAQISGTVDTNTVGEYTISYTATDEAGNSTTVIRTVKVVDTTKPEITIDTDDENSFVTTPNVSVVITDVSDLAEITYSWDGITTNVLTALKDQKVVVPFDHTEDGVYTLTITAKDVYGNTETKQVGPFTVDTTMPEVSDAPTIVVGQKIITEIKATDALSGIKEVLYAWSAQDVVAPTKEEFKPYDGSKLTLDVDGTYYLWVIATDNAGNANTFVSSAYTVDNAYPEIDFEKGISTFAVRNDIKAVKEASIKVIARALSGKELVQIEYVWSTSTTEPTEGWVEWDLADYEKDNTRTLSGVSGTYYLWVRVKDSIGLTTTKSTEAFILDNDAPEVSVTPEDATDTKKIEIKVDVEEDHTYDVFYAWTTDADHATLTEWENFKSGAIYTDETSTGTYYLVLKVEDEAGNAYEHTYGPYVLDNTAPDAPEVTYNKDWTRKDLEITATGEGTIEYKIDNGSWQTYDATSKIVLSENATITLRATDTAGNVSAETEAVITNIDKVKPSINVSKNELELGNKIDIDVTVTDTLSGIKRITYGFTTSLDEEPTYDGKITSFTRGDKEVTGNITKNDESDTYYVWIRVVDEAANVTEYRTDAFHIDVDAPEVDITPDEDTDPTSEQEVDVYIYDDEDTSKVEYVWSTSANVDDVTESWTQWTNYSDENTTLTLKNVTGTYYLHVKATDKADNVTTKSSQAFVIVNDEPSITISPEETDHYEQSISAKVDVTPVKGSEIISIEYAFITDKNAEIDSFEEMENNTNVTLDGVTGTYYLCVRVTDDVDGYRESNIVCSSGTYLLDNEKPEVTITPNGTTGIVSSASSTITATDELSKLDNIYYAWSTDNTTEPTTWESYTDGETLVKDDQEFETVYLWVKATDKAGNEKVVVSNAFVIDKAYPEITIDMSSKNAVQQITGNLTVEAKYGKTVQAFYYWSDQEDLTPEDITTWTEITDYTTPYEMTYGSGLNGKRYLYVKALDSNGLSKVERSDAIIFDNKAPEITLDPVEITEVASSVTVGVSVKEIRPKTVYYYWSTSEVEEDEKYQEWTEFDYQNSNDITFDTTGIEDTMYLHIKVVDKAGNIGYAVGKYVIDTLAPDAPEITISTEDWTKNDVTVTITGTDTILYKINDGEYQEYTESFTVSENATITAKAKDAVENESDETTKEITNIDKSNPSIVITPDTLALGKDINVSYVIKDTISGIKNITYGIITNLNETPVYDQTLSYTQGDKEVTGTITKSGFNGTYYIAIKVEDNAGNILEYVSKAFELDNEGPEIVMTPSSDTNPTSKQEVTVGITDAHEITNIQYVWSTKATIEEITEAWTTWTSYSEEDNTLKLDNVTGTYYLYVKATDKAGNETVEKSSEYIVITDTPSVTITPDSSSTPAKSITATVDVTEVTNTTITKVEYAFVTDKTAEITNFAELTGNTVTLNDATGTYYLCVRVTDNVDGERVNETVCSNAYVLDNKAPEVSVTPEDATDTKKVEIKVDVEEDHDYDVFYAWTTDPDHATLTEWTDFESGAIHKDETSTGTYYLVLKVEDEAGNAHEQTYGPYVLDNTAPEEPEITISTEDWTKEDVTVTITGTDTILYKINDGEYQEYTESFTVSANATITAKAKDAATNESDEVEKEITNIDKTADTIVVDYPKALTNKAFKVNITTESTESPIVVIRWAHGTFNLERMRTAGTDITSTKYFSCGKNRFYTIYVKDEAGNESIYHGEITNIDTDAPEVTITPSSDTNPTSKQEVTVGITDAHEITSIQYVWSTSATEPTEGWSSWASYSETNNTLKLEDVTGTYYLYVKASDELGNEKVTKSSEYIIVNEEASVIITPENTDVPVRDVTATIDVTEATGSAITKVEYAFVTDKTAEITNFAELTGNTVTLNNVTGTYYLCVRVTDNVDGERVNEVVCSNAYELDNEGPEITLDPEKVTEATNNLTVTIGVEEADATIYYYWSTSEVEEDEKYVVTTNKEITFNETNVEETYYLHVKAVDTLGNETVVVGSYVIDNKAPEAPEITISTEDWTNGDVTVTITGTDTILYKINDGEYQEYTESFTVSANATITAKAKDSATNESSETVKEITNIDTTVDTIVVDYPAELTNKAFRVNITTENTESPIVAIRWAEGTLTVEEMRTAGTDITANKFFSCGKNRFYTIYVKDEAGNEAIYHGEITNIDTEVPKVSVTPEDATDTKKVEIKVDVKEDHDYDVFYAWTTDPDNATLAKWENFKSGAIHTDETSTGTYYLVLKVEDAAGNAHEQTYGPYVLDNTAPAEPEISVSTENWTRNDVTVTITGTDTILYKINDGEYQEYTGAFTVSENAMITTKAKDAATNESAEVEKEITNIDKSKPSVVVTPDSLELGKEINATFKATDTIGGIKYISYGIGTDANVMPTLDHKVTLTQGDQEVSGTIAVADLTGTYYIWIRVVDMAGNTLNYRSEAYVLDNEGPEIVMTPSSDTNPTSKQEVTVDITDAHEITSIQYVWSTKAIAEEITESWSAWTSYSETNKTLKLDSVTGTYYLYVKATDKAGNETVEKSNEYVIVSETPEVTFNPENTDTSKEVTITVTATEVAHTTITKVEYAFVTDKTAEITNFAEMINGSSVTLNNVTGTYYLCVRVTDSVDGGRVNETVCSNAYVLDNEGPEITLDPEEVTEVTNNLTVTVGVEEADATIYYYWSTSEVEEEVKYTVTTNKEITFEESNADGTYYLHVKAVDTLGNETVVVGSYVIDNTAPEEPEISVSTENWTNGDVTVTITGTDTILYKINDGEYQEYTGAFTVSVNATITAKAKDAATNESTEVEKEITNIDTTVDTIVVDYPAELTNKAFRVNITTENTESPIVAIRWAEGTLTVEEMRTTGTDITANKFFSCGKNRFYTIYVKDEAGNEAIYHGEITNIDTEVPTITLNGDAEITLPYGTSYEELGAVVNDNHDTDLEAVITGTVDLSTVGTYTIYYNVTDHAGNAAVEVTRTVHIVDEEKPVITLNGDATIVLEVGETFKDEGAIVTDNYDADVTIYGVGTVNTNVVGEYTLYYNASDSSSNEADEVTRKVIVLDKKAPAITLNGDAEITLEVGSIYNEEFASAYDAYDGVLTDQIKMTGNVNTSVVGDYEITYEVTDSSDNKASVKRIVHIVDNTAPTITLKGNAIVTIPVGGTYVEEGVTITDNYVTNITPSIKGTVNTLKAGTYVITYTATDGKNTSSIERIVQVESTTIGDITIGGTCDAAGNCYSTPVTESNYVWYSGYLWRVVKVNADGSVKLVTDETVSALSFNSTKTNTNYNESVMKDWLENTFYASLNNASTIVKPTTWCTNSITDVSAKTNPCTTNISSRVGLLTIDEYQSVNGASGFLNTGDVYYTLSGNGTGIWVVKADGTLGALSANYAYGVRPSIVIASSNKVISGNGSKENPYRLELDQTALDHSKLSQRYSGEYVSFANKSWRIVSKDANGTKLVLDSYVTDANGEVIRAKFGQNTYFNVNTGIGALLNTTIYESMFTSTDASKMLKTVWYDDVYEFGGKPLNGMVADKFSKGYVGLLRVGELMAGQSATLDNKGLTYWTMSHTEAGEAWYVSTGGMAYKEAKDSLRTLRPVIKLNSNVTIASGTGTSTDPYVLY